MQISGKKTEKHLVRGLHQLENSCHLCVGQVFGLGRYPDDHTHRISLSHLLGLSLLWEKGKTKGLS